MNNIKKARVEMLPLMDVIFLLLVFFIYAMLSMTVHHGVKLNLPESATAMLENQQMASVSINDEEQVFFNKEQIDQAVLVSYLKEKKEEGELKEIRLFADKAVPYQKVFEVLDKIKQAGIEQISLQAEAAE